MPKIYTKTGDKGRTGTFRGRISKSDDLAEALGAIDELNSWIGLCRQLSIPEFSRLENELRRVQNNLMTISSALAGSGLKIKSGETGRLERLIDKLTEELPKLSNFIYPVGELQITRAVCRRAERAVAKLNAEYRIQNTVLKYLNRLSDALFVIGRWVNREQKVSEEVWRG